MAHSESASPWGRVDPDELAARFKRHELMELGEVLELIDQSREVLMKEKNVITVQVRRRSPTMEMRHPPASSDRPL